MAERFPRKTKRNAVESHGVAEACARVGGPETRKVIQGVPRETMEQYIEAKRRSFVANSRIPSGKRIPSWKRLSFPVCLVFPGRREKAAVPRYRRQMLNKNQQYYFSVRDSNISLSQRAISRSRLVGRCLKSGTECLSGQERGWMDRWGVKRIRSFDKGASDTTGSPIRVATHRTRCGHR